MGKMKFFLALLGLLAGVFGASAQGLDYGAATNTMTLLAAAGSASGNQILPFVVGILLFCLGVGVYKRLTRKSGIGT
jgi:hypothetical protein